MILVRHRVNTIAALATVDPRHGVEVDVRANNGALVLTHDPFAPGERLDAFLDHFHHRFIMFNIKESGTEEATIGLAAAHGITKYLLMDVEHDFIHRAADQPYGQHIAIRYSEVECLDTALHYRGRIGWIWMNTYTRLPIDAATVERLRGFRIALVCPERWGRPGDIPTYLERFRALACPLDLVMTAAPYVSTYEAFAAGRPT